MADSIYLEAAQQAQDELVSRLAEPNPETNIKWSYDFVVKLIKEVASITVDIPDSEEYGDEIRLLEE